MNICEYSEVVTSSQVCFGKKLGLDLIACTIGLAEAKIADCIDLEFHEISDLGSPTSKQIELALKFGFEISGMTRREGSAIIDDIMHNLNQGTIKNERLAPGVVVTNIHDQSKDIYTISSIRPDGTCYFKGGNGQRAWARSLRRVETT